ncbi:MAG: MFS transporter [Deltaproteobacteria bacterium]
MTSFALKRGLSFLPFYYGWVIVVVSALAMLATLPGRTHGLGMITERVLQDPLLNLDRVQFGEMNFWATILGAAFCLPCGTLLDRFGTRLTLTAVTFALGGVVLAMTQLSGRWAFFGAILLTRGLGQSALSVVSLAMPGKWFSRRLSLAMGAYTVLMAAGFISAFQVIGAYRDAPWRSVWAGLGYALLFGITPIGFILVRNAPEECGLPLDGMERSAGAAPAVVTGATLRTALREPAFWAFALATSMYGLVSSGISLFNEAILVERGFTKETYYTLLTISTGLGLAGNFLAGWIVHWTSLRSIMGLSMSLLGGALFWMPFVGSFPDLVIYAVGMALGGGMMTVVFFTAFGQVFGRLHLGQIQGVAQMLTVFASALGPLLLAHTERRYHSYMPFFQASALGVLALVVWTCFLRIPVVNESLVTAGETETPAAVA